MNVRASQTPSKGPGKSRTHKLVHHRAYERFLVTKVDSNAMNGVASHEETCSQSGLDDAFGGHPDMIAEIVRTDAGGDIVWRQEATPKIVKRQRWKKTRACERKCH